MNSIQKYFLIGTILLCAAGNSLATIITFDDLPFTGPTGATPVPNGYGGLNWNNFGELDGLSLPTSYGYHTGVVSPNNVAYNFFGEPATISDPSGVFDLESAYLTFALNLDSSLNVEVRGYNGAALLYDNTYTVTRSGPTLVDFNYAGVNKVTFSSSPEGQEFAMDNVDITVPDKNCTLVLLGIALAALAVLKASVTSARRSQNMR